MPNWLLLTLGTAALQQQPLSEKISINLQGSSEFSFFVFVTIRKIVAKLVQSSILTKVFRIYIQKIFNSLDGVSKNFECNILELDGHEYICFIISQFS